MAMVCPQCRTTQVQGNNCTSCGSRLLFQANLGANNSSSSADLNAWQQTPWGRLIVGLLLSQGLAYGLSMLWTAAHLAATDDAEVSFWATEFGFIVWQAMQGVGLLIGGGLAGAGQSRGTLYAAFIGLVTGLFTLVIRQGRGDEITPFLSYSQPVFHVLCGAIGGFIGATIWRPLPVVHVPAAPEAPKDPRKIVRRPTESLAGPVCWFRVVLGVIVVVAGVLFARNILNFVINNSEGRLSIQSSSQARILTLEVAAFAALIGAGFAGATTQSGLKHGFIVGVVASILATGINLGRSQLAFDAVVLMSLGVFGMSLVGGWFGGMLFPPTSPHARRRGILHE